MFLEQRNRKGLIVLEKIYLTNRHIVGVFAFHFQELFWCEPRKFFEIIYEMGLVIIAAFVGNACPVRLSVGFNFLDGFLKTNDLQKCFWSIAYMLFENFDKVFLGIANLFGK